MNLKRKTVILASLLALMLAVTAGCTPSGGDAADNPAQTEPVSDTTAENSIIVFNDDVLEQLVRGALEKPDGDILVSDALSLTELDLQMSNLDETRQMIHHLDALQYFTNLTYLGLGHAVENEAGPDAPVDISALGGLTKLESLHLGDIVIDDVSALSGLTSLKSLSVWGGGQLCDLTPLAGLTSLEALTLHDNAITDVSPLAGLTGLTYLDLTNNQIADISPLTGLTGLTALYLEGNPVADYAPLAEIRANLEWWDFDVPAVP